MMSFDELAWKQRIAAANYNYRLAAERYQRLLLRGEFYFGVTAALIGIATACLFWILCT